jgi:hypothetical protein
MVGKEEVTDTSNINTLPEGAGKSWALKRKEIFGECPHRPKRVASVYFIGAGDRIKIGFSHRPTERLKDLQTSHHLKLELLATMPGSYQTEARLHKQFSHLKQKGEWFVARPELLEYIDRLNGKRKPNEPEIVGDPPRAPDAAICRTITGLIKSRRSASPQKRLLMTNLIEQLRNYNVEGNPVARANLERMINWSVQSIAKAA